MNYKLSPLRAVHGRLALRFLNYLSKQPNFKHMTQCLSITTHILVKAKMYDEAKELLRNLTKLGLGPKLLFDDLMLAYTKCNSNPSIFDLLIREILACGICPNVGTFNILLNALCIEGKINKAGKFIKKMEEIGYMPTSVTYNTLIDKYIKKERFKAAFKLLENNSSDAYLLLKRMKTRGMKPNEVSYNTLVTGLCKEGKTDLAMKVLDEMLAHDLVPNGITYNTLIDGHCRKGDFQRA
ncbi:hypothetical protein AMTR_s00006p00022790 [Amborella trichopoda]|uniref:Pentacotripeptide-repeat region of PRORP domain-containing protein n=1 Tax=Amborella trichopoda TaxID=13333 RepID=W1PD26_AMBTC|nr:hypothetical protein AMTR_s00006p00022790 [Amborella trichopoda]